MFIQWSLLTETYFCRLSFAFLLPRTRQDFISVFRNLVLVELPRNLMFSFTFNVHSRRSSQQSSNKKAATTTKLMTACEELDDENNLAKGATTPRTATSSVSTISEATKATQKRKLRRQIIFFCSGHAAQITPIRVGKRSSIVCGSHDRINAPPAST